MEQKMIDTFIRIRLKFNSMEKYRSLYETKFDVIFSISDLTNQFETASSNNPLMKQTENIYYLFIYYLLFFPLAICFFTFLVTRAE